MEFVLNMVSAFWKNNCLIIVLLCNINVCRTLPVTRDFISEFICGYTTSYLHFPILHCQHDGFYLLQVSIIQNSIFVLASLISILYSFALFIFWSILFRYFLLLSDIVAISPANRSTWTLHPGNFDPSCIFISQIFQRFFCNMYKLNNARVIYYDLVLVCFCTLVSSYALYHNTITIHSGYSKYA